MIEFQESGEYVHAKNKWSIKVATPFRLSHYAIWKRALDAARGKEENKGVPILAAWEALLAVAKIEAEELDLQDPALDLAAWAVQTADIHIAQHIDPKG